MLQILKLHNDNVQVHCIGQKVHLDWLTRVMEHGKPDPYIDYHSNTQINIASVHQLRLWSPLQYMPEALDNTAYKELVPWQRVRHSCMTASSRGAEWRHIKIAGRFRCERWAQQSNDKMDLCLPRGWQAPGNNQMLSRCPRQNQSSHRTLLEGWWSDARLQFLWSRFHIIVGNNSACWIKCQEKL